MENEVIKKVQEKKEAVRKAMEKLSLVDRMLIMNYINEESQEVMNSIALEIDRCIQAMLITHFPEKSYAEIIVLADEISDIREDQDKKLQAWNKKYSGQRLVKEVSKLGEKLEKRIKQLVKSNVPQNVAIKTLQKEFNDFPKVNIVNTYKKVKDDMKAEVVEAKPEDVGALADYILTENQNQNNTYFRSKIKVEIESFKVTTESTTYNFTNGLIDGKKSLDTLIGECETLIAEHTAKIRDYTQAIEYSQKKQDELEEIKKELIGKGVLNNG